jgi:hypothetical protein
MADAGTPGGQLAPMAKQGIFEIELDVVGSNTYGRYPKINQSQTYNMMISDGWLVDYAGFLFIQIISAIGEGRGDHTSTVFNRLYAVVGSQIVYFNNALVPQPVGNLTTSTGEVFIAENTAGQVAFSDGVHIYIYDQNTSVFSIAQTATQLTPMQILVPLDFKPGFLSFQNTYFICASIGTNQWRLCLPNNGLIWPTLPAYVGQLTTKPDTVQAVIPMPGRGNMTFVMGKTVAEQWTFQGGAVFPWTRNNSISIDYGCISPGSIAYQGNWIVWVGISEEAGPVIMYTTGSDITEVSTDGIDYLLSTLTAPEDCSGFLVKLDGHLFYQVTFKTDNITLALDLTPGPTQNKFFTITDENMNFHPARKIVFFNNTYYFVSFNDGNLYAFGTQYTTYQYVATEGEIPRVRICSPIRLPGQRPLIFKSLGFTIEQGQPNFVVTTFPSYMITEITEVRMLTEDGLNEMVTENTFNSASGDITTNMEVFLAVSRDGGETFGNAVSLNMNFTGKRKSRFIFQRLGRANDFTARLQFVGFSRYVVGPGQIEAYL